jgi:hypothetical protein
MSQEDIMFETKVPVNEMKPGKLLIVKKTFDKSLETEITSPREIQAAGD